MYTADDATQLTYVRCGILGAMLALNRFPGVGHVEDPVDAYTFAHVNDGNAVAMPVAKGFGHGPGNRPLVRQNRP